MQFQKRGWGPRIRRAPKEERTVDGILFASRKEADRYKVLKQREQAGEISDLKLQPRFPIVIDDVLICTYVADFWYLEQGKAVVEDAKGMRTELYKLKLKLMEAVLKIPIWEV